MIEAVEEKNAARSRRIIENLRSGVPSPSVASDFPMGREGLLERIKNGILEAAEGNPHGLAIQANYGEGKTHLLHAIWNLAAQYNCVVSFVCLSKETTLDKIDKFYAKTVANTYVPGSTQPGLDRLLASFAPGKRHTERLLQWVEQNLHPKLSVVLSDRLEGGLSLVEDTLYKLDQDLAGILIGMADLKAIHRLIHGRALQLATPFRVKTDMFDYFLFVERMIIEAGYSAWVILLDEAELIGSLGRGGRAASYATLARLFGHDEGLGIKRLSQTFTVVAVASNFLSEVLSARDEVSAAPAWLEARGRVEEAALARRGIEILYGAEPLPPLSRDDLQRVMEQIIAAHEVAYGWNAGLSGNELLQKVTAIQASQDARLRTLVRTAIQWLDLRMQYGTDPALEILTLAEELYDEVVDEADA